MAKRGLHEQRGRVVPVSTAAAGWPRHAAAPQHSATYDWGLTPNKTRPLSKRARVVDVLLLVLAIALVAGGVVYGVSGWHSAAPSDPGAVQYVDMAGNQVIPDDPQVQDPSYVQSADPQDYNGLHFKISSVGLDVPLREASVVDNVINPPGYTSVYLMRNLGVPLADATTGTVYVAAHSLRAPGRAPGNFVIDPAAGVVVVKTGAEIDVGDRVYSVVSSRVVSKPELSTQADLWTPTPGMLVFVTCLQSTSEAGYQADGHAKDNAVIIGQLVK
ncbi:MAG: hypothetical protein FWF36_02535 [Propionibacteriaceae bacterium]|nr:hypothetical protein [Propionibacteriaceae bacterium]